MKKSYLSILSLLAGFGLMVQTNSGTFQVDMGSTTVNTNGVHIAGSF